MLTVIDLAVIFPSIFVSSAKHRHYMYEKTLKSSGKCFIYANLLRHTNKVSLRFQSGCFAANLFFADSKIKKIVNYVYFSFKF